MVEYLEYFHLARSPFGSGSDGALLLETGPLRRVVAWVGTEVWQGTPVMVVNGPTGVGRTSVARALPFMLEREVEP